MTNKIVIAIVALVVGLGLGFMVKPNEGSLGSIRLVADTFAKGIVIGDNGSLITDVIKGNASSCTASSSVAANKSANMECAVSGVLSTDMVFISPGAATSDVSLSVVGAYASSTANGYVRFKIANASTSAITSTQDDVRNVDYLIVR